MPTKKELEAIEAEEIASPNKLTPNGVKVLMEALAERDYLYTEMLEWSNDMLYNKAVGVLGLEEVGILLLIN